MFKSFKKLNILLYSLIFAPFIVRKIQKLQLLTIDDNGNAEHA